MSTPLMACPEGWVASPNASFSASCYYMSLPNSDEFRTSMRGCTELCAERAGATTLGSSVPVCYTSAEEMGWLQEAWGPQYMCSACSAVRTGIYKDPSTDPDDLAGWNKCVDGREPHVVFSSDACFFNAEGTCPENRHGAQYCMGVRGSGASISSCDKYGMDPVPCLCAGPATPTAAFAADLVELEGTAERYRAAVQAEIVPYFLVIGLIALIPTYVVGITRLIACARRRGDAADQRTAVSAADRTKQQLQRAGEAAAVLRVRVSFTLLQLGLLFFFYGFAPTITMFIILGGAEVAWGPFVLWYNWFPLGTMLMLLAIRPTNEVSIRVVSAVAFSGSLLIAVGMGLSLTQQFDWMFFGYALATLISAILLARPMLCMCCCQNGGIAQPPRAALRQLWLGMRWFIFSLAAVSIVWPIRYGVLDEPNMLCALIYCINSFVVAAVLTPANRGRAHRLLGNIGAKNTKEQEAACIAALIGGGAAGKALDEGGKRFRALPLSVLTEADLSSSTDSGLHRKTKPATLGDVDGFISHSWQDDGAVKYARLHEWAKTDGVRNDGAEHPLIWLDKACINQDAIEASLRGLPVFLSGCRSLVVLAGPTYTSRLWYAAVAPRRARDASEAAPLRHRCVVELFVWLRVGGARERITVSHLASDTETQALFAKFRASSARCYKARDRQHLLAVIESGFGDLKPFDKLVRGVFSDQAAVRPEDLDNTDVNPADLPKLNDVAQSI